MGGWLASRGVAINFSTGDDYAIHVFEWNLGIKPGGGDAKVCGPGAGRRPEQKSPASAENRYRLWAERRRIRASS